MSGSPVASALRTLELNEARWQAVLKTARDAIISIDKRGRITLFNQAAEAIFGYTSDEVLGLNVASLMPAPYRDQHNAYIRSYQTTGKAKAIGQVREVEACRKDGTVFPIELAVSEARVGSVIVYTAIIRDISERQQAQLELRLLQQRAQQRDRLADMGAITAKIVHDLGNPLAGLSMQAQLVMRRASRASMISAESVRQPIEQILGTVQRLDALVKEFMDFARDQNLSLRSISLPRLLQDIIGLWRPVAAARDIQVSLASTVVDDIEADETQLKRVFDNLVKNAIEAIGRGPGQINISPSMDGDQVRVAVQDTGPGFPPSIQGFRLFETTKPDGTGLGLAVARQIVLAHGGEIGFGPVSPHGTVFHIDLPKKAASPRFS